MIIVTCAIIRKDNLFLAVQRSACMKMPLKWEFPGGKLEEGEKPEVGLKREILEELQLTVKLQGRLKPVIHDYGDFTIQLLPFLAGIQKGSLYLQEHAAFRWLEVQEMKQMDWAEADWPVVLQLLSLFGP